MCLIGEIARFQPKIPVFKWLPNSQSLDNKMKTFLANSLSIVQLKNIIFDGWDARCKGARSVSKMLKLLA